MRLRYARNNPITWNVPDVIVNPSVETGCGKCGACMAGMPDLCQEALKKLME